jgi:AraC-like DNA-binding protein
MAQLGELLSKQPLVPYIRAAGFAVRKPWTVERRRLLDYLLVFFRKAAALWNWTASSTPLGRAILSGAAGRCSSSARPDRYHHAVCAPRRFLPCAARREFFIAAGLARPQPVPAFDAAASQRHQGIQVPLRIKPSNVPRFRETLLRMVGVWQQHDPLSQLEAQNLAADLVLSLLRDYSGESAPTAQAPHSLNWITSYLLLHLGDSISVADMARRAQLSPSRFAAVFRQTFGCAPHAYLLHLRIGHAQELLSNSDSTIEQVARLTGFVSVHHFARTFKKMTGRTPGQWRKMRTTPVVVSLRGTPGTGSETRIGV